MQALKKQSSVFRVATNRSTNSVTDHGPSSSDRVAQAITDNIMIGRYVPGQRFIEGDLARDLQVSRGTIREALKHLSAERVISLEPHRGAYVRVLTKDEALELLEVLGALVGLALTLAAARIDLGDHRRKLTAAYARLRADGAKSDRILHSTDRSSFYDVIFDIAQNRELWRVYPAVPTQILRMQVHPFLSTADLEELFADYSLLYDALLKGDAKKARKVIEVHGRHRASQMERLPPRAFAIQ